MELTRDRSEPATDESSEDAAPIRITDRRDEIARKLDDAWALALQELFAEPQAA